MFEDIRQNIKQLIALYETERERNSKLVKENEDLKEKISADRKQIDELESQIKILQLKGAFDGGSGKATASKETIDNLIKEIDRCISLLKG